MSEQTLSSADLYRGTSDTEEEFIPPLKETRLYGMVQAEFQYFDGNSWSSEWSSGQRGGVPLAIAITFDFPNRADFKAPEKRVPPTPNRMSRWTRPLTGNSPMQPNPCERVF